MCNCHRPRATMQFLLSVQSVSDKGQVQDRHAHNTVYCNESNNLTPCRVALVSTFRHCFVLPQLLHHTCLFCLYTYIGMPGMRPGTLQPTKLSSTGTNMMLQQLQSKGWIVSALTATAQQAMHEMIYKERVSARQKSSWRLLLTGPQASAAPALQVNPSIHSIQTNHVDTPAHHYAKGCCLASVC